MSSAEKPVAIEELLGVVAELLKDSAD